MNGRFFCSVLALALAACRGEGDSPVPEPTPTAPETPQATAIPALPAGGARQVSEETDTFLFEYSYPQAAGDIPELARWLNTRLEERRNALAREAARGQRDTRDNGFPFNKYASGTDWEVVADLPEWLSLSAEVSNYSGGAHPNYGFDAMVWDKARNSALEPIDFFSSPQELDAALKEDLCSALNAERAKRRGEPVEEESGNPFTSCVEVNETNLLLGSEGAAKFDRIGVQIAPYLAGPYAEGSYEFTFPMTDKLLETVRPEYREAFTARN